MILSELNKISLILYEFIHQENRYVQINTLLK